MSSAEKSATPDFSSRIDMHFRDQVHALAAEINAVSGGHNDDMKTPGQSRPLKQKMRQLVSNAPHGHFEDPRNRRLFWREIEAFLDSFKGSKDYNNKLRRAWHERVLQIVNDHRASIKESISGISGKVVACEDVEYPNDGVRVWTEFQKYLEVAEKEIKDLDLECLNTFYDNLNNFVTGIIYLFSEEGVSDDPIEETQYYVVEILELCNQLREDVGGASGKAEVFSLAQALLSRIRDNCPLSDETIEFIELEIADFEVSQEEIQTTNNTLAQVFEGVGEESKVEVEVETVLDSGKLGQKVMAPELSTSQANFILSSLRRFAKKNPNFADDELNYFLAETTEDFKAIYAEVGLTLEQLQAYLDENLEEVMAILDRSAAAAERSPKKELQIIPGTESSLIDMVDLPESTREEILQNIAFLQDFRERYLKSEGHRNQLINIIGALSAVYKADNIRSFTLPQITFLTKVVGFIRENFRERTYRATATSPERKGLDSKPFTLEAYTAIITELIRKTSVTDSGDSQLAEVQDMVGKLASNLLSNEEKHDKRVRSLREMMGELSDIDVQEERVRESTLELEVLVTEKESLKSAMPDPEDNDFKTWSDHMSALGMKIRELRRLVSSINTQAGELRDFDGEREEIKAEIEREKEVISQLEAGITAHREKLAHVKTILSK